METIRPLQESDLPAVESIVRKIWDIGADAALEERHGLIGDKKWQDWIWNSIADYMRQEMHHAYVLTVDSEVAGFGNFRLEETRSIGKIGYNGVHPKFQGRGIGKKLLEYGLVQIRQSGMRLAIVVTGLNEGHAPARHMYEKAGFQPLCQTVTYTMDMRNWQPG